MDPFSFDQLRVFLAIVDSGSFSGAARQLQRAQSAVSYAIANLEGQLRVSLFERVNQRPLLTPAGRALLADARKVLQDVDALRARARGLAQGLESELSLAVDLMFPMAALAPVLESFRGAWPTVALRLQVAGSAVVPRLVLDGRSRLGICAATNSAVDGLRREPLEPVEFTPVAAAAHPLARAPQPVPTETLREHLQLVFGEQQANGRSYAVIATRVWQVADLAAKHTLLLSGLGWGNMPRHVVEADIAAGRLVRLWPAEWTAGQNLLPMHLVHRADDALGKAARWLADQLGAGDEIPADHPLPRAATARRDGTALG
ncbi:MAG: LysR family transcriptional regulator [Dongiaceae bacterium]